MESYRRRHGADGDEVVEVTLRGRELLSHPMYNKGSAFTAEERRALGLEGILPHAQCSEAVQRERAFRNVVRTADPLEQYIALAALQDRNEILFHRIVLEHLEELAPVVYTPTVGRACQEYSHIFRRGRGMWITPGDRGRIEAVLANAPFSDVRLIVATDNERILGLGDQGAGGIGIPIGKLVLYTAGAGIHPTQVLPVSLDVGTDNAALLDDPLYLGWRERRLRGAAYDELIEEFVSAVQRLFPRALLQWEDFKKQTAFTLLDRYKQRLLSFNDDIQGTAAVALAGVMAATRITRAPMSEQRVVILGAGAAGVGIARQLRDALARAGVEGAELVRRIAVLDSRGLLVKGKPSDDRYKDEFAWPPELAGAVGPDLGLEGCIAALRPTVLIGTSGTPGSFGEHAIRTMAAHVERPVVMPFSNPTSKCEAQPADVIRWSDGRAIAASGSPFDPVEYRGRTIRIGQGNNVYVFPGVGLGALVAEARAVTDSMFTVAAETLAQAVEQRDLDEGSLYPRLGELRAVSARVAAAVAVEAGRAGVAAPLDRTEAERRVAATMWLPRYPKLVPA